MGDSLQIQPLELPSRLWDVLVVGAGPAGATASLHLATAGWSVLMVDKELFPRDKVCGDGLIADSLAALERAGLLGEVSGSGHVVEGAAVYAPSGLSVEVPGRCVTLRRKTLDAILAREARKRGVLFARGRVRALRPDGEGVAALLAERPGEVRARVVLVATGADLSLLGRRGAGEGKAPSAMGVRTYIEADGPDDSLTFAFHRDIPGGYGWIFPLGQGLFNVGCWVFRRGGAKGLPNPKKIFPRFLDDFPPAAALLKGGRVMGPARGSALRCGLKVLPSNLPPRILPIGEAAGTTLPLSGEGVGKAMESGEFAAAEVHVALSTGCLEGLLSFPGRLKERLDPVYRSYERAARLTRHPWLTDLFLWRARGSEALRRGMAGIVTENASPASVFSARGLIGSLFAG